MGREAETGTADITSSRACFLDQICVLILTFNEEANIGRTLGALVRFPTVVMIDSGSTDKTLEIARRHANVRVVAHAFESHAAQWNFGLTAGGVVAPWILALDADYIVPESLVDEIAALPVRTPASAYRAGFRYCVHGRPLSGTLYPPTVVLYRRDRARCEQQGHANRVIVDGAIQDLSGRMLHDDRKPLSRWFATQTRYVKIEADYLLDPKGVAITRTGRIRLMMGPAPALVFFYTLLAKRCILDGRAGWFYALQRMMVEIMIALELLERRWSR